MKCDGWKGLGGNREVSPLCEKRPRRRSRLGLLGDIASDVALSARADLSGAGAEAIPKEGGSWGKHGFPHGGDPNGRDVA